MFGPKKCWPTEIRASKKLGAKSLAKIGSVTVEILLTWTNVARTNVAWTNIILTDGICSKCSQEPTFKVSAKSGQ